MAGTLHGMIDCFLPTTLRSSNPLHDNIQGIFTLTYKFMKYLETLGVTTEVARQGGLGATAANVNFWDEANPFKTNAFFVFRFNANAGRTWPWYFLMQYSEHSGGSTWYFGASPGAPGLVDNGNNAASSGTCLGTQAAIGIGGDQNPWNGTGSMGTNLKGGRLSGAGGSGPVWTIPSGGTDVLVFPRSNYTDGAHATNKQNCLNLVYRSDASVNLAARAHFLADADSFIWLWDHGDTGAYTFSYNGLYVPASGVTVATPFCQVGWQSTGTTIGPIAGTSNGGGIVAATGGTRQVQLSRIDLFGNWTLYPSQFRAVPGRYEVYRPQLVSNESSHIGYLGEIDFWREVTNVIPYGTNSTRTKLVLGTASVQDRKLVVPWDGSTPPRRNNTVRTGITF